MKYDIHLHTEESSCSRMSPKDLVKAARSNNLDGVVVTDHDTTSALEKVKDYADNLEVYSGVEISTSEGHIIGIEVPEAPPKNISPAEAIDYIHSNDGYAVIAHPFDRLRQSFDKDTLDDLIDDIDAIEVRNSRCVLPLFNSKASDFAERNNIPQTGGSDSHFPFEVGRAFTETGEKSLLEALDTRDTTPSGRGLYFSGHLLTKTYDAVETLKNVLKRFYR